MTVGALTLIRQTVPTVGHSRAAQRAGEDADTHLRLLAEQIAATHSLARHILSQIMRESPTDPNVSVMRDVLELLS